MKNAPPKLWNKDFILLLLGMLFSLFANTLLRFTLPLYILIESGDPALMATVLTLTAIPLIILSPMGGVLADRVNKKKILVVSNLATAFAIVGYLLWADYFSAHLAITVLLFTALTFEGLISPAQDSSIPSLVPAKDLLKANGMTFLITTVTSIIGPIFAGLFLAQNNLLGILLMSISAYLLASFFKALMKMPYHKQATTKGIIPQAMNDIKSSIHFMRKENPIIGRLVIILFVFCLFTTPMLFIGLPVLITGSFDMGEVNVGISTAIKTVGSVVGLALVGMLGKKMNIKNSRTLLLLESAMFVPVIVALLLVINNTTNFVILTASFFIMQIPATIVVVVMYAYVQEETPEELVGKVIAFVGAAIVAGSALGGQFYGELFAYFGNEPWVVLAVAFVFSLVVALFANFPQSSKVI